MTGRPDPETETETVQVEAPDAEDEAAPAAEAAPPSPRPRPALDPAQQVRLIEALLFASAEPLDESEMASRLPDDADLAGLLDALRSQYAGRGVVLVRTDRRWAFRTAPDLAPWLRLSEEVAKKPSRAAIETLAIVAYHQPVTRAEIESIRGVATSKGTLDLLMESGWIKPGRRRESPGRPLTWITTDHFLDYFGLASVRDLPGVEDLRAAGLLDARPVLTAFRGDKSAEDDGGKGGDEDEG